MAATEWIGYCASYFINFTGNENPTHARCGTLRPSLASQPYFSLFPVGGARGRVWTLWPASRGSALIHEIQIWLVRSKWSTWLPARQLVYHSLTTAFYDTDFALGFILHRCWTGTSRVQEQHQDDLLLNSQVAGSRVCGRSCSRWNYRPRPLSRRFFVQRVQAGSFWMTTVVGTSFTKHIAG